MANLVVGNKRLALAIHHGRALHTSHNPVYTVINLLQTDACLAAPTSQNGSLQTSRILVKLWTQHRDVAMSVLGPGL